MTPESIRARLLRKIEQRGPDDCWPWLSGKFVDGYGSFWMYGKSVHAHRAAYRLLVGDPGSLFVCHSCDNPACCNPAHLWLGTHDDNMRDRFNKGRCRGLFTYKKKGEQHG